MKSTHHFVSVSFSNSTTCDVCGKSMANKASLQCESKLPHPVHERIMLIRVVKFLLLPYSMNVLISVGDL